jgi:hypothetical protein
MRGARGERGQILPLVVIALVALLGIAAFSIDVGYAYYAKRQLQSATDAAALAGAQDLPNASTAIATATSYAVANTPANLSSFNFTYQVKCTATSVIATGCNPSLNPNALVVSGTASTNAWFSRLFGIDHFDVSAHANACSPCSSAPVDIVIAIDRTGSMCTPRGAGGTCTDLDNAKDGVRTMLGMMNPPSAQIGMVAFPPVQSAADDPCSAPYNSLGGNGYDGYDAPDRGYVTDTISGSYKSAAGGALDPSSGLYLHTVDGTNSSCIQAGGNTSYSEALRQAEAELTAHGRPDAPDYIVFLTDGEANIGSVYGPGTAYPQDNADDQQPCHTAINLANQYKAAGTTIYSIGYALGSNVNCTAGGFHMRNALNQWVPCSLPTAGCFHYASPSAESPAITSYSTLSQIASPGNFYNQPTAGELDTIFAAVARDIAQGSSRLVDDGF